jgi:hypothetical protein
MAAKYTKSKVLYFASKEASGDRPAGIHVSSMEEMRNTTLWKLVKGMSRFDRLLKENRIRGHGTYYTLRSRGEIALIRENLDFAFQSNKNEKIPKHIERVMDVAKRALTEDAFSFFSDSVVSEQSINIASDAKKRGHLKAAEFMEALGLFKKNDGYSSTYKVKKNPFAKALREEFRAVIIDPSLVFTPASEPTSEATAPKEISPTSNDVSTLKMYDVFFEWFGHSPDVEVDVDSPDDKAMIELIVSKGLVEIKAQDDAYIFAEITEQGLNKIKALTTERQQKASRGNADIPDRWKDRPQILRSNGLKFENDNPNLVFPKKTQEAGGMDLAHATVDVTHKGLNVAMLVLFEHGAQTNLDPKNINDMKVFKHLLMSGDIEQVDNGIDSKERIDIKLTERGVERFRTIRLPDGGVPKHVKKLDVGEGADVPRTFDFSMSLEEYQAEGEKLLNQLSAGTEKPEFNELHWAEMHDKRVSLLDAIKGVFDIENGAPKIDNSNAPMPSAEMIDSAIEKASELFSKRPGADTLVTMVGLYFEEEGVAYDLPTIKRKVNEHLSPENEEPDRPSMRR